MSTLQEIKLEPENRGSRWITGSIYVAIIVVALGILGSGIVMRNILLLGLMLTVGAGIFPFTYIAYLYFRAPAQRERLKQDFRLLGLASEHNLDNVVDKQYNMVYSRWQFIIFIVLIVIFCFLMGSAFLVEVESKLLHVPPTVSNLCIHSPSFKAADKKWKSWCDGEQGNQENEQSSGTKTDDSPIKLPSSLIFFGFLGAYLFSVQELIRRYNTFDLLPQVYSSIFARLVFATGIAFAASTLITGLSPTIVGIGQVVAFLIGFFPQRGLDWLSSKASPVFAEDQMRLQSARPLGHIIGISPWHESRLAQLGIDDAQNLATVDIGKLLLTTQFDTQEIVNWIDQSILYVKTGDKITDLRAKHINTFFELDRALGPERDQDDSSFATLGVGDLPEEAKPVMDATNYPNYAHIVNYYIRSAIVVKRYAEEGGEALLGS